MSLGKDPSHTGKTPSASHTELAELMMPQHANILGKVFGGVILSFIDKAGATAAIRHAGRTCVTAQLDRVTFRGPVEIGELVRTEARLTCVGRSSMEVEVRVYALNVHTGAERLTNTSYVTMVAIDEEGRPTRVPELILETDLERQRCEEARQRMQRRKTRRLDAPPTTTSEKIEGIEGGNP